MMPRHDLAAHMGRLRRAAVATAMLAVLLVSGVAGAQGFVPDWVRGLLPAGQAPGNPLQALDLSQTQGAALADLARRQARFASNEGVRLGKLQAQLALLYAESPMDSEAIRDLYGQIFDIQTAVAVAAVETYNEQLRVLDERQRALWSRMRGQSVNR